MSRNKNRVCTPFGTVVSRMCRVFVKLFSLVLTGLLVTVATPGNAQTAATEPLELTFSFGPDDSGSLRALIERFNKEYEGEIRVTWREMARDSDAYFRQLASDFSVGAADTDIIGADVIWTAEFVTNGWVEDLTRRFYDAYNAQDFLRAPLNSVFYRNRVWGVPWYTDAGLLYYRRDLLEASGFSEPPATWDELTEMAQQVTQEAEVPYGFVFQGAEYEGGVANALEYIWSAGGNVLTGNVSVAGAFGQNVIDPNVITVASEDSAQGLDVARGLIESGVAPEVVTEFREKETYEAFLRGEAVFMRNWPFAYGLIGATLSQLSPEQVGVAPLPTVREGGRSFSTLGGWNLMVSASSENQEAAWTFIRYVTDPAQQKQRALSGGFLPTLSALYDDAEIAENVPVIALGGEAIQNARVRPVSPFYSRISPRVARAFTRTLEGELSGQEAVRGLQRELETILRQGR